MSDINIGNIKYNLLEMFLELDDDELINIEQWINSRAYKKGIKSYKSFYNFRKWMNISTVNIPSCGIWG